MGRIRESFGLENVAITVRQRGQCDHEADDIEQEVDSRLRFVYSEGFAPRQNFQQLVDPSLARRVSSSRTRHRIGHCPRLPELCSGHLDFRLRRRIGRVTNAESLVVAAETESTDNH
jgi:hypothetical protein